MELGSNFLGLVGNVQQGHLKGLIVWLVLACQDVDHCCLACAVLAEHHDDFRGVENASLDVDLEGTEGLRALWVRVIEVLESLLFLDFLRSKFSLIFLAVLLGGDAKSQFVVTETHLLSGDVASEENVDSLAHGEGHRDDTVSTRGSVEAADEVGEVVENGKIVFHNDHILVVGEQASDHAGGIQTLLDVEVRTGLVEHVNVYVLHAGQANNESLELTARKLANLAFKHVVKVELFDRSVKEVLFV